MERTYLEHLLSTDRLLTCLGGAEMFTALPEFGFSTLKYNRLPLGCAFAHSNANAVHAADGC